MGEHTLQFAALVGSRICHDLISPIGAINNGMELLSMSGGQNSPEMELIAQSVDAANARIRFFRIAYGAPNKKQHLGQRDITALLHDISKDSRLDLHWHPQGDISRSEIQLAFLAIQCAEQALPYGGRVDILRIDRRWQLDLSAERLILDPDLWDAFAQPVIQSRDAHHEVIPAHVQFLLLPMHASSLGRSVSYQTTDTGITLSI